MAYHFYLGSAELPIPPKELQLKIENRNETISLLDGNTVNIIKKAGLTSVSFQVLLPNQQYPFLQTNPYHPAEHYLAMFENLKTNQKAFHFVVTRSCGNNTEETQRLFGTDLLVTLEEYSIREAAELGYDCEVDISLKQYRPFSSKLAVGTKYNGGVVSVTASVPTRPDTREEIRSYTASGKETLWEIACIVYGDGALWEKLYTANADQLQSKSGIVPKGTILTIPWR